MIELDIENCKFQKGDMIISNNHIISLTTRRPDSWHGELWNFEVIWKAPEITFGTRRQRYPRYRGDFCTTIRGHFGSVEEIKSLYPEHFI